jgi:hypothetical protein
LGRGLRAYFIGDFIMGTIILFIALSILDASPHDWLWAAFGGLFGGPTRQGILEKDETFILQGCDPEDRIYIHIKKLRKGKGPILELATQPQRIAWGQDPEHPTIDACSEDDTPLEAPTSTLINFTRRGE